MDEAQFLLLPFRQIPPIIKDSGQQPQGPQHIRLNESIRSVNGTVHMALSRKINDGSRFVFSEKTGNDRAIADIALNKVMALGLYRFS